MKVELTRVLYAIIELVRWSYGSFILKNDKKKFEIPGKHA
jgi:hypothetical protein